MSFSLSKLDKLDATAQKKERRSAFRPSAGPRGRPRGAPTPAAKDAAAEGAPEAEPSLPSQQPPPAEDAPVPAVGEPVPREDAEAVPRQEAPADGGPGAASVPSRGGGPLSKLSAGLPSADGAGGKPRRRYAPRAPPAAEASASAAAPPAATGMKDAEGAADKSASAAAATAATTAAAAPPAPKRKQFQKSAPEAASADEAAPADEAPPGETGKGNEPAAAKPKRTYTRRKTVTKTVVDPETGEESVVTVPALKTKMHRQGTRKRPRLRLEDVAPEERTLRDIITSSLVMDRRLETTRQASAKVAEQEANKHLLSQSKAEPEPSAMDLAPQVQVVDGRIVVNQNTLVVQARRTEVSGYRRVVEDQPLLNSHSYSNWHKPVRWNKEDTELFFKALTQFGLDLTLISQLFPTRTRSQIKQKYIRESKKDLPRVEACLSGKSRDMAQYHTVIAQLKAQAASGVAGSPGSPAAAAASPGSAGGETRPAPAGQPIAAQPSAGEAAPEPGPSSAPAEPPPTTEGPGVAPQPQLGSAYNDDFFDEEDAYIY